MQAAVAGSWLGGRFRDGRLIGILRCVRIPDSVDSMYIIACIVPLPALGKPQNSQRPKIYQVAVLRQQCATVIYSRDYRVYSSNGVKLYHYYDGIQVY